MEIAKRLSIEMVVVGACARQAVDTVAIFSWYALLGRFCQSPRQAA
jgi:hypothetical protein